MAKKETYLFCCPDSRGNCDSFGFQWYSSRHFHEILYNCMPKKLETEYYKSDAGNAIIYVNRGGHIIVLGLGPYEILRDPHALGPKEKLPEGSCSVVVDIIEGKENMDKIEEALGKGGIKSKGIPGFWKGKLRRIC